MKILLVEPDCQRVPKFEGKPEDERLLYPPLALMKLARFHHERGDEIQFVRGIDKSIFKDQVLGPLFPGPWDRVYITTLFTFHYENIIKTINFYKGAVGGTTNKIYVGGIMASLMPERIFEATNIPFKTNIIRGIITSSKEQLGLGKDKKNEIDVNIDQLAPLYAPFDTNKYAISDTLYAYTTRGCINKCPWCGVPTLEPKFISYIDIKPSIIKLRDEFKEQSKQEPSKLKLMDNNVLASKKLGKIVDDLLALGYGRNEGTSPTTKKKRVVDFNQGLDATFITEENMALLSKLNIKPMRIAFDHIKEKSAYLKAVRIANKYKVGDFSNYMLYNFEDTPKDLYDRLVINIQLNEEWVKESKRTSGKIYSYPMKYAPIVDSNDNKANQKRDHIQDTANKKYDWLKNPQWTLRFMRNIEIMKGAAHGAISPTPTLARRTIGGTFDEFIANLYMPEELLRNRNKHEKKIYKKDPNKKQGTGKVEEFRKFILDLLKKQNERFSVFHAAVSGNSIVFIREALRKCEDKELKKWLEWYIKK